MQVKVFRIAGTEFPFESYRFIVHSQDLTILLHIFIYVPIIADICVLHDSEQIKFVQFRNLRFYLLTTATSKISFSFVKKQMSECSMSPLLEKPNENHLFLAENALSTLNITSFLFQSINQLSFILSWSKRSVCSLVLASPGTRNSNINFEF